jgi:hypothetical protein
MMGCGKTTPPPPSTGTGTKAGIDPGTSRNDQTAVLVNMGGFASVPDQIVSFAITIESVALRSSTGDVELLANGNHRRFELTRHSFRLEPLAFTKVPQGHYSAIVVTVSNPAISFEDAGGVLHQVAASLVSPTQVIGFPFFSVGARAVFFDLALLPDAVSFGTGDVVNVTPHFASLGPSEVQNGVGIVDHLVGRVTTVGSSSIGIDFGNDLPCCSPDGPERFVFATNPFTNFSGSTGPDALTEGSTVEVNAVLYEDGSFYANDVELENSLPNTMLLEGVSLVAAPTQIKMLVREVHGPNPVETLPVIGEEASVFINASTQFQIESKDVDLKNLDFSPVFDAITIAPGQNVRTAASSASADITAEKLQLEEQSIEGDAGALNPGLVPHQSSFSLKLSADSALAKITGADSVLVVVQPSTYLDTGDPMGACISCVPGKHVRVYGLLFYTGGEYRLVASEVSTN